MNERKATKRALLTSITALVMCVVMLAGTTFAWFTDTASTNVNKIQAGKLDVKLEMATAWDATTGEPTAWDDAEGETLNWVKAQGGGSQATLWEPGAEYKLPELKVVNNGNLALKYEIKITGAVDADGNDNLDSTKLLDVLKFKSVVDNTTKENAYGQTIATGTLDANGKEQIIKLSAKMDENAGNGYMNMALSNITVTVKAMQASYEYDSNGNTYDQDANGNPDNPTWSVSAHVTATVAATGDTVLKNADGTVELTAPAGSINNNATSLTLRVEPKTAVDSNIIVNAGQTAQPYEISLVDENNAKVTATGSDAFTVKLYVGKGLNSNNVEVYHNSAKITATYDNDGYVTFTTSSFSPFTVVFDTPVAIVGDTYYNTLAEAVEAAKDGDTITLLKDVAADVVIPAGKTITLDLGGHKLTNVETNVKEQQKHTIVNNGTLTITGTGTVDNVTNGKAALVNYGTATLNGGNFTRSKENPENNKNNGGGNSYYTILNDKGATMTINEGVTVSNVGHFSSMICNCGDANPDAVSTMTINGGTFSGGINTVKNDGNGVLTINGGDFSNTSQVVIMNWHRATISGGTFEANASAEAVLFTSAWQGNSVVGELTIKDGTYVCAKDQEQIIDYFNYKGQRYQGTAVISGGTFSSQPDNKYIAEGCTATESEGVWTVARKSQSN